MKSYLCIDPGANGGWVLDEGSQVIWGDNDGLVELCPPVNTTVVIEKVPEMVA